jgi:hypothetical protein
MSYWAELDSNNIVLRVLKGDDNDSNQDGGLAWIMENLGGTWIETAKDNSFRKHYAGIGYTYSESLDAFIPPQCHDEASLDETTCLWICDNDEHNSTLI